jgi:hypothetical protein
MDTDHKLLCLLSTLQSIFPRDSRLGAGGGKAGMSRRRVINEAREESKEERAQRFTEEATDEIYSLLQYEWKRYKRVQYLPKDLKQRNMLLEFLKEEAIEQVQKWRKLHNENENLFNKIQTKNMKKVEEKPAAVKAKSDSKRRLTAIQSVPHRGGYTSAQQKELDNAIADYQKCTDAVDELKWSDPEQLYTQVYLDCRQEKNRLEASVINKRKHIFDLRRNGESREIIKGEKIVLADLKEKYFFLKKIHDDMWNKELKEIDKGTTKRR